MKRKPQMTLDLFLNIKGKRRQFFYIDWTSEDPIATWLYDKPNNITWENVVNWRNIGDVIICCNSNDSSDLDITRDITPFITPIKSPFNSQNFSQMSQDPITRLLTVINNNPKNPEEPIVAFLKSHIQKSIRRQLFFSCAHIALYLLRIKREELFRRVSISIFEDVKLKKYYANLMWFFSAFSKGYQINISQLEKILLYITDICGENSFDTFYYLHGKEKEQFSIRKFIEEIEIANITQYQRDILYSILFRVGYGGREGDIDMILGYAKVWLQRFEKGEDALELSVPKEKMRYADCVYLTDHPLGLKDVLYQAADFHCYAELTKHINQGIGKNYDDDNLKACIWEFNSKINMRKDNKAQDDEEGTLEKIWYDIKNVIKRLQLDFCSKIFFDLMGYE